jgi:hypothetical protein
VTTVDTTVREALELIAASSGLPQARSRAARLLMSDEPSQMSLTITGQSVIGEDHWTGDQLRLIAGALLSDRAEQTRSATLPAVRLYPEEREAAEQLAAEHGMSLADWVRHRVTNTLGELRAREDRDYAAQDYGDCPG